MPSKIVDLSARSHIIRDEPFHLHFWELSLDDVMAFLKDPRGELKKMGIDLPDDCRIETTIENHDWLSKHTDGLTRANGTIGVESSALDPAFLDDQHFENKLPQIPRMNA